jgi:hypothetical protein
MLGVEAGCELKSVSVVHIALESHGVGENQMSGSELVSVSGSHAFESESSGGGQLALVLTRLCVENSVDHDNWASLKYFWRASDLLLMLKYQGHSIKT